MECGERARAETVSALRGGVTRLARRLRSERPRGALSPTKLAVLAHLYAVGPSTPSEVAEAEHQQLQSLTRVFADLERTALISRAPSEDDRRASVLTITSEGVQALGDDMVQRDRWLADALLVFTDVEVEVLRIAAGLLDQLAGADAASAAHLPQT